MDTIGLFAYYSNSDNAEHPFAQATQYIEYTQTANYWYSRCDNRRMKWTRPALNRESIYLARAGWYDMWANRAFGSLEADDRGDRQEQIIREGYHNCYKRGIQLHTDRPEFKPEWGNLMAMWHNKPVTNCIELEWLMDDMAEWYK